jgi:peptidoglycan/LPS O-acetylase OafA/YrhL
MALTVGRLPGVPHLTDPIGWPKLTANLLFLQDLLGYGNIAVGTWFVCVDLQIAFSFAALLWLARRLTFGGDGGAGAWAIVALFAPLGLLSLFYFNLDPRYDAWAIYFFFTPLLGAAAWWTLEGRLPRAAFWGYVALLAGGAAYRWHLGPCYRKTLEIAFALAAALLIYAAGRRGRLGNWLSARWMQYLGRVSYSLFLIHYPVGWLVLALGSRWDNNNPWIALAWFAAALAASIPAAELLYRAVERPCLRLSARFKR